MAVRGMRETGPRAARRAVFSRLTIRSARAGDAPRIAIMANELARITTGTTGRMTAAAVRRDLVDKPDLHCLVADRSGEAVGYALWSVAYETAFAARGVYLSDLYVEETQRNQGIARSLMRQLALICEDRGGRFIWWAVAPTNKPAQAFYDSLGATDDPVEARAIFEAPFRQLLDG